MREGNGGITLLEVLLVLAILSSIIVMTVRYFTINLRGDRITQAISDIKLINHACYEWTQSQRQENFSNPISSPNSQSISIPKLIAADLITSNDPNHSSNFLDPWGGVISVSPARNRSYVKITLNNVPQMACRNLLIRTQSLLRPGSPTPACNNKRNIYYGEF